MSLFSTILPAVRTELVVVPVTVWPVVIIVAAEAVLAMAARQRNVSAVSDLLVSYFCHFLL